ncbi:MAG: cysteine desulfurase [Gammaproteobacteria bacterium]|nr:cysteine desulfurase [Gammaproteobacteria bacterium]
MPPVAQPSPSSPPPSPSSPSPSPPSPSSPFDVDAVRAQFPLLSRRVHAQPLVYLDNGATAQKPQRVIDAIESYYRERNANIHRGAHHLSQEATTAYEAARETVRAHLNAEHAHEMLFTSGTTAAINTVASAWGGANLNAGDEVIVSTMEHHSNIVPWQLVAEQRGASVKELRISRGGELRMEELDAMLSERVKMVALTHVSNVLGTVNPARDIIERAHAHGALVLLDGAQAAPHLRIDVRALDVDFYAFSGHKVFGPTGVGVLYGKEKLLDAMPPYQGGGEMIERVTFARTTFAALPHKFEAGTPNIVGGIGLGVALDWLAQLDAEALAAHEKDLLDYATAKLNAIDGVTIFGDAAHKACVLSFLLAGTHPFDVGAILDQLGIAVRTGHHCAQPLMEFYDTPGMVRASFALYNNRADVDALVAGVERAASMLV